LTKLKHIT